MISGAIPAKFRGIPRNFAEFRRNCAEITSEVKKFRGIPCRRNSVDTLILPVFFYQRVMQLEPGQNLLVNCFKVYHSHKAVFLTDHIDLQYLREGIIQEALHTLKSSLFTGRMLPTHALKRKT